MKINRSSALALALGVSVACSSTSSGTEHPGPAGEATGSAANDEAALADRLAPQCVDGEKRACMVDWTDDLGKPHCFPSTQTCTGEGRAWTACGESPR